MNWLLVDAKGEGMLEDRKPKKGLAQARLCTCSEQRPTAGRGLVLFWIILNVCTQCSEYGVRTMSSVQTVLRKFIYSGLWLDKNKKKISNKCVYTSLSCIQITSIHENAFLLLIFLHNENIKHGNRLNLWS